MGYQNLAVPKHRLNYVLMAAVHFFQRSVSVGVAQVEEGRGKMFGNHQFVKLLTNGVRRLSGTGATFVAPHPFILGITQQNDVCPGIIGRLLAQAILQAPVVGVVAMRKNPGRWGQAFGHHVFFSSGKGNWGEKLFSKR